jgi:hypothetical protein
MFAIELFFCSAAASRAKSGGIEAVRQHPVKRNGGIEAISFYPVARV